MSISSSLLRRVLAQAARAAAASRLQARGNSLGRGSAFALLLWTHALSSLSQAPDLAAERFAIQRDNVRRGYANFFKEAPRQHALYLASRERRREHRAVFLLLQAPYQHAVYLASVPLARVSPNVDDGLTGEGWC